MIAMIALANTFITPHNYHFFMARIIKTYSLRKLDVYKAVSLSTVTVLCLRAPGFLHW